MPEIAERILESTRDHVGHFPDGVPDRLHAVLLHLRRRHPENRSHRVHRKGVAQAQVDETVDLPDEAHVADQVEHPGSRVRFRFADPRAGRGVATHHRPAHVPHRAADRVLDQCLVEARRAVRLRGG